MTTSNQTVLQGYLDAEAAAGGFHGYVTLTGKTFTEPEGQVWYEIDLSQPAPHEATAWVSWDVEPDPKAPAPETTTAITGWVDDLETLTNH